MTTNTELLEEISKDVNQLSFWSSIDAHLAKGAGFSGGSAVLSGGGNVFSGLSTFAKVSSSNDPVASLGEYSKLVLGVGVPEIAGAYIATQADLTPLSELAIGVTIVTLTGASLYALETFENQPAPLLGGLGQC